jgi:hypothetical protein
MADALKGNLAQLSLLDVMRMLSAGNRTGQLDLMSGKHRGEVFLNQGKIVHAASGAQIGESAIYSMLNWRHGEFNFKAEVATPESSVKIDMQQLLQESAGRAQEWDEIAQTISSTDLVLKLSSTGATGMVTLQPEDWQVLAQVNGLRSIEDIAVGLNRDEFSVAKTMHGLIRAGLLIVNDQASSAKPSINSAFLKKMESEFVEIIGPLAPVIIESEIAALGESAQSFPRNKVGQLVERVCREIDQEDKRIQFQKTILDLLKNF